MPGTAAGLYPDVTRKAGNPETFGEAGFQTAGAVDQSDRQHDRSQQNHAQQLDERRHLAADLAADRTCGTVSGGAFGRRPSSCQSQRRCRQPRSGQGKRNHPATLILLARWSLSCLLLELKCVQEILPIHKAQLLSYMRLLNIPLGLIINFHELKLVDGLVRMMLPGANR